MSTPWGDDAVDDSSYNRDDDDVYEPGACHHGISFNNYCELCEIEEDLNVDPDAPEEDF